MSANSATASTAASYSVAAVTSKACEIPSGSVKETVLIDSVPREQYRRKKSEVSPKVRRGKRRYQKCENTSSAVDRDARFRLRSLTSTIGITIRWAYLQVLPKLRADAQRPDKPKFECPACIQGAASVPRNAVINGSVPGIRDRPYQSPEAWREGYP